MTVRKSDLPSGASVKAFMEVARPSWAQREITNEQRRSGMRDPRWASVTMVGVAISCGAVGFIKPGMVFRDNPHDRVLEVIEVSPGYAICRRVDGNAPVNGQPSRINLIRLASSLFRLDDELTRDGIHGDE